MKDKIVSYSNLVNMFQSKTQMSYGSASPTAIVSGPPSTLFYAWMGSVSPESVPNIALGTIFRWRVDTADYPDILNQDRWRLLSTGTVSQIRIEEIKKEEIPNHHAPTLPATWGTPPSWVNSLITEKVSQL